MEYLYYASYMERLQPAGFNELLSSSLVILVDFWLLPLEGDSFPSQQSTGTNCCKAHAGLLRHWLFIDLKVRKRYY